MFLLFLLVSGSCADYDVVCSGGSRRGSMGSMEPPFLLSNILKLSLIPQFPLTASRELYTGPGDTNSRYTMHYKIL